MPTTTSCNTSLIYVKSFLYIYTTVPVMVDGLNHKTFTVTYPEVEGPASFPSVLLLLPSVESIEGLGSCEGEK